MGTDACKKSGCATVTDPSSGRTDQAKTGPAGAPVEFCRIEPRFSINTKGVWTSFAPRARSTGAQQKPTKKGGASSEPSAPPPNQINWATHGLPGCPCCIGPPDTDFEEAYQGILDLGICGMTSVAAQKFVRLCTNDRDTMRLSKKKRKGAAKLTRPPLSPDDVARMQRAVLVAYRMACPAPAACAEASCAESACAESACAESACAS